MQLEEVVFLQEVTTVSVTQRLNTIKTHIYPIYKKWIEILATLSPHMLTIPYTLCTNGSALPLSKMAKDEYAWSFYIKLKHLTDSFD